jgi:hypothetical protein
VLDAETGPVAPSFGEATTPEAAQANAATTSAQTDGADGGEQESGQPRTFTQQELDEIVSKRVAKAESRTERRVLKMLERFAPQQQKQAPQASNNQREQPDDGRPQRQEGEADDAYLDRLTDWKLEQRELAKETQQLGQKTEALYKQAAKLPDFDREAFDDLPLTKEIVGALVDADNAPELMHFMAANPEEVERIAAMKPSRQAAEIGKLEVKLAAAPKPHKPSRAPEPINPVGTRASSTASALPSDSDDIETWVRKERERLAKR